MIKATVFERYIFSTREMKRQGLKELILEERYFTSREKFQEWYDSFKGGLWEDDKSKVDLVEGIYVRTEDVKVDDISEPKRMRVHSTFRNGVSYHYAA